MGIVYWRQEADQAYVATNMQGVALDPNLWAAYVSCGQKGRAIFQQCAVDDYDWSLDTVLAYAAHEENPPPPVIAPPPKPIAKPTTIPVRARAKDEDTNGGKFVTWIREISAATKADSSLSYMCGTRRELRDGTVAVSVAICRSGNPLPRGTSFVFHYHPGAQGAHVGHAAASKWHFKPFDGAQKWVRLEEHGFGDLDAAMLQQVKKIARGR